MLLILRFWRIRAREVASVVQACLAFSLVASTTYAADVVVSDIRVADHGAKTRIVFDLSNSIEFKTFVLTDPNRMVLDLPEVRLLLPTRPLPSGIGLLRQFRYGLFQPGQSRVVIDLSRPAIIENSFLMPPVGGHRYRLVIDLLLEEKAAVLAESQTTPEEVPVDKSGVDFAAVETLGSPATKAFALPPRKPRAKQKTWVIALDSGHGGVDPGGIGASGTYEKHITLAMAREIGAALEKTGRYKAVLVRDRDVFIRLRDRIAIARTAGADLFISLHADVIANKAVRGLSVYTLSEKASDEESALLADMSNKSDLIAGVDLSNKTLEVTNILIDLAQRETMNDSSRFAGHVVKQLSRETKLLNNTHRFAGFAVLKAPDVPSVLIELGFLSNVDDEAALKNRSYRDKLSQATVRAVEDYFQEMEQAQAR
jgi:N-acetylmuramoyl-L-alanine amidase